MKTWHWELLIVSLALCAVTFFVKNDIVNWITTCAVIATFQHAQISDRLQEQQRIMNKPTVECYWKLNYFFVIKEILWVSAFILMQSYSGIIGCGLFAVYPFWRKYYRKYNPVKS